MRFESGPYLLDVDVARTQAYYAQTGGVTCTCAGCRNFVEAVSRLPTPVRAFLDQFGIDPGKPAEMSPLCAPGEHTICYDSYFFLCGDVLEGREPFLQTGPKSFRFKEKYHLQIGEGSDAHFDAGCKPWDSAFPLPAFQLCIFFTLPWVLDEPNPYT